MMNDDAWWHNWLLMNIGVDDWRQSSLSNAKNDIGP
jgi:hypothetical protein